MTLESIDRILLIRLKMIGDVLLTTPAVHSLRLAFPRARITYLTGARARDILANNPDINEIMVVERGILAAIASREPYDLTINFGGCAVSDTICLLSGARYRIGMGSPTSVGPKRVYNIQPITPAPDSDVIDGFLNLTRAVGARDRTRSTKFVLTQAEQEFARTFVKTYARQGRDVVGIHPGGHGAASLWPEENFAALADGIVDRLPVQVFIFQSPGEEATAAGVYNRMQRRLQAVLIPPLSLRRYASLVSVCRVFVAHDRGPMHIAASLGPAVVGVFTSRQAPYWFPYSEREGHVYFQKDQVSHITVKEVLTACRSLLGRGDVRQPGGTEGK